jgi:hypothetical protein
MHYKKALTIVECLVSIVILAVILTAGMAFYFNSQIVMRGAIHKRIAVEMASAELEIIKNMDYTELIPPPPQPTLDPNGLWLERSGKINGKIDIGDLSNCYKNVYIDPNIVAADYRHVRVVVYWQEFSKNALSSLSLDTYIAP